MARPARMSLIFLAGSGVVDPYAALRDYVAFWKFDEPGATDDILDSSTNVLHVPTLNSPTTIAGKVGTARRFLMASTQYGSKASTALLKRDGKTWSINFWFYITTNGIFQILVSRDDGAAQREFAVAVSDTNKVYVNLNSTFQALLGTTTISLNTWYNVQVDFTTGTKEANLYINGSLEHSITFGAELNSTTAAWIFGAYAAGASNHLDGRLDNCYLYDKLVDPAVFYAAGAGLDLTAV